MSFQKLSTFVKLPLINYQMQNNGCIDPFARQEALFFYFSKCL